MTTMNYLLQHTKKFWLGQVILSILSFYKEPLVDNYNAPLHPVLDVILKAWITILMGLFLIGWTSLVFHLIADPSSFQNAQFGVFDYL